MNETFFEVPGFARLTDYVGLWLIEPTAAACVHGLAKSIDLRAHVLQHGSQSRGTPGGGASEAAVKSSVEKQAVAGGSVAIVKLTGLLMKGQSSFGGASTVQARREIRTAAQDPDIGAILLAIDSPGGTAAGTDDLAQEVKSARKQKPVWAHVDDMAASAAYWVASQAERITVNSPTALIGSIGTFNVLYDVSAAMERDGVRTLLFATGPLKGMGTFGSKITDEQVSHMQGIVNAIQSTFDAAVQKGRKLTAKELAGVRHGGVMPAGEAMGAKLIDGIQPLAKTLSELGQAMKSQGSGVRGQGSGFDLGVGAGVVSQPVIRLAAVVR